MVAAQRRQRAEMLARQRHPVGTVVAVADRHGLPALDHQRAAEQLPPEPHQRLRRQRALVAGQQAAQHAGLPAGPDLHAGLAGIARHALDQPGAAHKEVVQFIVDGVDPRPQVGQDGRRARDRQGRRVGGGGEGGLLVHRARLIQPSPGAAKHGDCAAPHLGPYPAAMDQSLILPEIQHQSVEFEDGLALDCGRRLSRLRIAYRSHGTLNAARSNAVLVCHALTGDQYVAETHPVTGKPGWWERLVGPGRPIDTDKFFVICSNVLGGCMGSTGPLGPHDERPGEPWGTEFPQVTIADMVRAQKRLIEHLGIARLFAVVGGSMGGMQALSWAALYPDAVFAAVPVAAAAYHSAQNIAFHEIGRQAITADPDFHEGRYWAHGVTPARGLAVARMTAHITYVSEAALTRKFGRKLQHAANLSSLGDRFEVESYLQHQGSSFVSRFDANSYLTITRAMDLFDLAADAASGGQAADGKSGLAAAFAGTRTRFLLVSFSSDWLFPTAQSRAIARALNHVAANASFVEIRSDKGHDAFLLDEPDFHRSLSGFLAGCAEHAGLK